MADLVITDTGIFIALAHPFLTSETDPIFSAWDKSTGISITESQISDLGSYIETESDPLAVLKATFTTDGGVLIGTGAGTYQEETGATLRTSLGLGTGDTPQFNSLLLDQGTDDDSIFALRSSDITHPFTAVENTHTFFSLIKQDANSGGNVMRGFSGNGTAFYIMGYTGSTTVDNAPLKLSGIKSDGSTYVTYLAATEPLVDITNISGTQARFYGNGDLSLGPSGTGELTTGSINRASGSLTLEIGGTAEQTITSTSTTFGGNLVIPDSGYIGSVSDTDAIQIEVDGDVIMTQDLQVASLSSTGDITLNSDLADVTSTLTFGRTTGGNATVTWDGTTQTFDKQLRIPKVGIGDSPSAASALYNYNSTLSITDTYYHLYNYVKKTAGSTDYADDIYGFYNIINIDQSGREVGNTYGLYSQAIITNGSLGTVSYPRGLTGGLYYALVSGGTVTGSVHGGYSFANIDSGTISGDIYGHRINIDQEVANTLTGSAYGIFLQMDMDSDPGGSAYGIYFSESNNIDYFLYHNGSAPSRFGGIIVAPTVYSHNMNGETYRDLLINNSGELGYDSSTIRSKNPVKKLTDVSFLHDIEVWEYSPKSNPDMLRVGLMAEQLKNVLPKDYSNIVISDYNYRDGKIHYEPGSINYNQLIPFIIAELQNQGKELNNLIKGVYNGRT